MFQTALQWSENYFKTISLTLGTDNSKIIWMWTVCKTNPLMPAVQNRGFISNTSHMIQEYWASPLSKDRMVDSNGYREIDSLLDIIPKPYWPIAFNKQCIHFSTELKNKHTNTIIMCIHFVISKFFAAFSLLSLPMKLRQIGRLKFRCKCWIPLAIHVHNKMVSYPNLLLFITIIMMQMSCRQTFGHYKTSP